MTTPSQTVGPYFSIGLPWDDGPNAVDPSTDGAVQIAGTVFDGAGVPVPDAMIETWQVDPPVRDGFRAFARAETDDDGHWSIWTLKPGGDTPYLDVSVFARGLLHRCVTRIYFADDEAALAADPALAKVPPDRRATLLASPVDGGYRFDIHLQGPTETVFFDV